MVASAAVTKAFDLGGLHDSEDEDDDEDPFMYLKVRTGELDCKRTAALALGMLAQHSGPQFHADGHLELALNTLLGQAEYFHAKVRREVVVALQRMVVAAVVGRLGVGATVPWVPGQMGSLAELDPIVDHVTQFVVKTLTFIVLKDDDRTVVAQACECLQVRSHLRVDANIHTCMCVCVPVCRFKSPPPLRCFIPGNPESARSECAGTDGDDELAAGRQAVPRDRV